MMVTQLQQATDALFPSTGRRVVDVKFFRGDNRVVTAEQLAAQINLADRQIAGGLSPVEDIDAD